MRTKAFCVGQAKSGTATLYGLLGTRYRAAHEPERQRTLELILARSRGAKAERQVVEQLRVRGERLDLDYDIAWANQFIIGPLLAGFEEARFVVLIRDPFTWLRSMIGHLLTRDVPAYVHDFLDWWMRPTEHPHTTHERRLEEGGVYSVSALLHAWDRHVRTCTGSIPPERRLILRTHELNESHQQLADFLEIPRDSLDAQRAHLNRGTWAADLESLVEPGYLADAVLSVAGESMARHFPEIRTPNDADELWATVRAG